MSNASLSECLPCANRVETEHGQIQAIVERIQSLFFVDASQRPQQTDAEYNKGFLDQLGVLRNLIMVYGTKDEIGSGLNEVVSQVPKVPDSVKELGRQRHVLLEYIEQITRDVGRNGLSGRSALAVERDINELAELLYDFGNADLQPHQESNKSLGIEN